MHRRIAGALIAVVALAALMPYVSLIAEADADMPACCRGNGEHKCAMRMAMALARMGEQQSGDAWQGIVCRCPMQKPLTPPGRAALWAPSATALAIEPLSLDRLPHEAAFAGGLARARGNLKRGPPFPTPNS